MTVKIASQSNNAHRNLKSGHIIEIERFQVLKHSCENNHMQYSVILCTKLKIICFSTQLLEICEAKTGSEKKTSSNDYTNQK